MMLQAALIALMLQAAPAPASISGVAVNSSTGEPVANVRVSLARTDVPLGAFAQMMSGGAPSPAEQVLPGDLLRLMTAELEAEAASRPPTPEIASRAAAFRALPVDIHELILSPNGEVAVAYKSTPPTLTDAQGRFSFSNVPPGRYKLQFAGDRYARQDYGQRASGTGGVPVVLAAGESRRDLVMRLSAVAAISGHIRDAEGDVVAGVPVQVFRLTYDSVGQRKVQTVASTQSDDRGEYRIFHLSPGRYHLSAGHNADQLSPQRSLEAELQGGIYTTSNRIDQLYAMSYYPGVADENSAGVIDVPSGGDLRGMDLLVKPQGAYRIRGRVTNSSTSQPGERLSLNLRAQSSEGFTFTGARNFGQIGTDGVFTFQNVTPGNYLVAATVPDDSEFGARGAGTTLVTVANADIEGINLALSSPGVLSGRILTEGNAPPPDSLSLMQVQLRTPGASPTALSAWTPRFQSAEGGSAFRIENLLPGEYRVHILRIPAGFYVKSARFGSNDVVNTLRYDSRDSGTLDVVLSSSTGKIDGAATDASGQPMPGAQVVLIPNTNRQRTELFRPVTADSSGRFNIPAIVPGDYTLVAWESLEPFAFFDPTLIRQAESSGKVVRIGESSSQTINITAIR
jgi:hypothetical protein